MSKFQKNRHHNYETLYKVQVDFKWTCITPICPGVFQGIQKGSLEKRSALRVGLCSQHTLNSVLEPRTHNGSRCLNLLYRFQACPFYIFSSNIFILGVLSNLVKGVPFQEPERVKHNMFFSDIDFIIQALTSYMMVWFLQMHW